MATWTWPQWQGDSQPAGTGNQRTPRHLPDNCPQLQTTVARQERKPCVARSFSFSKQARTQDFKTRTLPSCKCWLGKKKFFFKHYGDQTNFRSGLTAVIYQMLGPQPGELTCLQKWENRPRGISVQCPMPPQPWQTLPPNEPLRWIDLPLAWFEMEILF